MAPALWRQQAREPALRLRTGPAAEGGRSAGNGAACHPGLVGMNLARLAAALVWWI